MRTLGELIFGSKEGLWRAVLEAQNQAALEVVPKAMGRLRQQASKADMIEALVDAYLEFLEVHPHFFRLIQWSELQKNTMINEIQIHWDVIAKAMEAVLAVISGSESSEDPEQLVMSIIGVCNAHLVYGNTLGLPLGLDVNEPDFLEARRAHLKRLLVKALV